MEYRQLGKSGLRVSALSFGSWLTFDGVTDEELEKNSLETMKIAYENGCNFFDTAEVYGEGKAEEIMGKVLKKTGWKRSDLVISTKIFWGGNGPNDCGLSRKHIIEGTKKCLQRLQLEYVDILFCHRPDKFTPIEETVRAMNWVIDQGYAFYWGTSEWSAAQIMEATDIAEKLGLIAPLCEQPQYSLLHRTRVEEEYKPCYERIGLGLTIWSPLASGLLTGKYTSLDPEKLPPGSRLSQEKVKWMFDQLQSGEGLNGLEEKNPDAILKKTAGLKPIAEKLGCTLAQMAIAWCLKNPKVSTVILGASNVAQVKENFKALEVAKKLDDKIMAEIELVVQNKPKETRDFRRPIKFPPV